MNIIDIIPGGTRYLQIQKLANIGLDNCAIKLLFKYAKIRGRLLIFVFSHPCAIGEFKLQKEQIKTRMREYYRKHQNKLKSLNIVFTDIEPFCIQDIWVKKDELKKDDICSFKEASNGAFKNKAKDEKLHKFFEDIRKTIREKQ